MTQPAWRAGPYRLRMGNLAWGLTNATARHGDDVVKTYLGDDVATRAGTEAWCLRSLSGVLPVPVLVGADATAVRTTYVDGTVGTDLVDAGRADEVCSAAGLVLRRLRGVSDRVVAAGAIPPGSGPVLVHGDFGPQNLLLRGDPLEVAAVVDWEWARWASTADEHADGAWFEWIIRFHHGGQVDALAGLWAAYGVRPPWPVRHTLMLRRCAELAESTAGGDTWPHRLEVTRSFRER